MKQRELVNQLDTLSQTSILQTWGSVCFVPHGLRNSMRCKLLVAMLGAFNAQAGPTGAELVSGLGTVKQLNGNTTITQSSQNLSLNWKSFNIAPTETVNFIQPSASAVSINRISDVNGSQILGRLNANGQVFLINTNGVLFGANAQVNVGALVASTLDMTDGSLNNGSTKFGGLGVNPSAAVTNLGSINALGLAGTGGYVALLGNTVVNQGHISAPQGTVALGAGSMVSLSFQNSSLVKMQVDQSVFNTLAENGGVIQADGGVVLMSAGAKNALLNSVVNNTGLVEARTIENHTGTIILLGGMTAGQVTVKGTLDASAPNGGQGGMIETSAASVKIDDAAKISTKSINGQMGTWLIDPTDFTIAASGGDITGAALSAQLANNSVVVQATGGTTGVHGDIAVNDAISWSANSKLTLEAARNININQTISATGTSGQLALLYGQGASAEGNTATYNVNAAINLPTGQNFTTLLGSDGIVKAFTVIRDLGVVGSASAADLQGMSGGLATNYALGANIDAKSTSTWNGNTGFAPIAGFTGTLDGLGHTVNGLVINLPGTASVGLIGTAGAGAVIQNIGLVGGKTVGGAGTGALVGTGGTSTIVNSFATGTVKGAASTGGLVGTLTDGHISRSYATGSVSNGAAASVGGLLGSGTTGSIDNSYATGNVQGGAGAGGLVGALTSGNVSNSFASGSVTGGAGSGGLVGTITTGSITNTYATGSVKGDAGTGGLVGVGTTGVITNSYATGLLTGTGAGRGGLIGSTSASHVGSFWDPDTTGMSSSTGGTSVAMTHTQLQTQANFNSATTANHNANPNWDLNNTWIIYDGLTMPLLRQFLTPLTITGATVNKTYDSLSFAGGSGVNYSTANYSSVNKLPNLDGTLTYGGTALGASNAGTYTIGLSGLYSDQQGYLITYVPGTLNIAKAPVSIAGVRFYDGTSDVNASIFSLSGVVRGQDLFLSGLGIMADQNVGVGKSISMGNLALRNGDMGRADNYTLVGGTQLVRINAAELTLTALDASKVYDGTLAITGTASVTRGSLFGTDALSRGGLSFVDKNVGNDTKTVTANGVTVLDGNAGANYNVTYVSSTTSTINQRPLLISAEATDKIYDGKTTASVLLTDNRVAGDSLITSLNPSATGSDTSGNFITIDDGHGNTTQIVSGSSGANFANKNVGANKTVFVVGIQLQGKDAANYAANSTAFSEANITPKSISVVATGQNKVYDGTLTDALILSSPGLIRGDYLNFTGTGTFASTAAAVSKLINVTDIVATGNDKANYSLISTTTTTTADITPKLITVLASAADKVYDGSINAVATLSSSGVLAQDIDNVQFNGAAKFSNKSAGVLKTVTVSGISATGSQSGNYQLKSSSASDKADISKATISVNAIGVDKVYDGNNKAALVFNTLGVVNGDTVNVASKTSLFNDKNVGTDKVITATGISLSGKDAANYSLSTTANANASTTALADVTAKSIGVTAVGGTMVYNASLNAPITLSSTGVIKGDIVSFTDDTALLNNKNVGIGKPVVVSGISILGRDATNYALSNTTALTKATVTALPISVLATANSKTFDNKTDVGVNLQSLDLLTGDVLNFTSTSAKFSNAAIGANKLVTVSGVTATGADAANYKIISKTLKTLGAITAAP